MSNKLPRVLETEKESSIVVTRGMIMSNQTKFFYNTPSAVSCSSDHHTLQCIWTQLARWFHVLWRDVFIRRNYCSP